MGRVTLVLDTSALVAILADEPEAPSFATAIEEAEAVFISAVTVFELLVVSMGKRGHAGVTAARSLLATISPTILPFDTVAMEAATTAYARYGKGIHPEARLNLADCAAYALARTLNAPLLFKGRYFTHMDVTAAC